MEERQKPTDHNQALARIEKGSKTLIKARDSLQELADPHGFRGQAKRFVVARVPWLRGRLIETPMASLQASLRSSIIDLHGGIGVLLREGRETVDFNNNLTQLSDQVKTEPDNMEAVEILRKMLMDRAEESLSLDRDQDTEEFLLELQRKAQEKDPQLRSKKLVEQAEQILQFTTPALQASEVLLVSSAQTLEGLHATYATVYNLRPLLDSMFRTSEYLARAQRSGVTSEAVIFGQIDLAIDAAKFAAEAAQIAKDLSSTVNPRRLRELESRAQRLLTSSTDSND